MSNKTWHVSIRTFARHIWSSLWTSFHNILSPKFWHLLPKGGLWTRQRSESLAYLIAKSWWNLQTNLITFLSQIARCKHFQYTGQGGWGNFVEESAKKHHLGFIFLRYLPKIYQNSLSVGRIWQKHYKIRNLVKIQ